MEVIVDFNSVEIRMIQSLWETKAPEHIAWLLDKPFAMVERKIKEMNRVHGVKLHERPSFSRKIVQKKKDDEWLQKKEMKIPGIEGKVLVRIDAKTQVYVKPGTDVELFKREYFKRKLSAVNKNKVK